MNGFAPEFLQALEAHDRTVEDAGLEIWLGAEPTYTNRFSDTPEWLNAALGEEKRARAECLLRSLVASNDHPLVLRTVGRQYSGEPRPRWSLGHYRFRSGVPVWNGPPDPLFAPSLDAPLDLTTFQSAIRTSLEAAGYSAIPFAIHARDELRILFTNLPISLTVDPDQDERLARASLLDAPIPATGLSDGLAAEGKRLLILSFVRAGDRRIVQCELPSFSEVEPWLAVIRAVGRAASEAGLATLLLTGFPPPVDDRVAWTTITPDPAVVEINMAPFPTLGSFAESVERIATAAHEAGLAPFRLYFNGDVGDSGGGGQITLGGPHPLASPFLVEPRLLSRLIRFVNHHPSLSYFFSHPYIGSCGQSVRSDEIGREYFEELKLSLALLARIEQPSGELIWRCLSPFLTDATGNSHRAELNIEKLWNPYLPGRGCLGLVEFRALGMPATPQRMIAIGALLRAIAARLMVHSFDEPLVDWGSRLHDRFALPFYLLSDLREVLADLQSHGFGLAEPLVRELINDEHRILGRCTLDGLTVEVKRGLEFWPLVGDTASQEYGASRLIDSSTSRWEICLRGADAEALDAWRVDVDGIELPLRSESDGDGPARVFSVRYRRFVPWAGLHPTLAARGHVAFRLYQPDTGRAWFVTAHEWRPDGLAYDGLPRDVDDARERRSRRLVVSAAEPPATYEEAPAAAWTDCCLDLRWLPC